MLGYELRASGGSHWRSLGVNPHEFRCCVLDSHRFELMPYYWNLWKFKCVTL